MQRYSSRNSEKNCAGTSRFQAFAPGIIINYKEKTNMNKKLEALQEYLKELGSSSNRIFERCGFHLSSESGTRCAGRSGDRSDGTVLLFSET